MISGITRSPAAAGASPARGQTAHFNRHRASYREIVEGDRRDVAAVPDQ
jgi:hypothetical protein